MVSTMKVNVRCKVIHLVDQVFLFPLAGKLVVDTYQSHCTEKAVGVLRVHGL